MMSARSSGLLFVLFASAACGGPESAGEVDAPAVEETSVSADALTAVRCRSDGASQCLPAEACLPITDELAVCSAGRCNDHSDCRDNYVCRAQHCIRVERDDPRVCPRGSVEGRAQCPAGAHAVQISRDPICSTCERDVPAACPDGSVEGRAQCPAGAHAVLVSEAPLCSRCERDRPVTCPAGSVEGRAQCPAGAHAVLVSEAPLCSRCERDAQPPPDRCGPNYHPIARGDCRQVLGFYWDGRVCNPLSGCEVTDGTGLYRTGEACERAFAECSGR